MAIGAAAAAPEFARRGPGLAPTLATFGPLAAAAAELVALMTCVGVALAGRVSPALLRQE